MRKLLSFTLVIFLGLSYFTATGFSNSDCGKSCCCASNMKGLHITIKHQAQFKGNCCSKAAIYPCGFNSSRRSELPICTVSVVRADTNSPSTTVVNVSESFTNNKIHKLNGVWLAAKSSIQSPPIYLQHLSLQI